MSDGGRSSLRRMVLIHWLIASIVITLAFAGEIARQIYPDPDDTMRRLEVRDLIAGQSWWDVGQHRLASGLMHWSRLVDLPLATIIWPLRSLVGEIAAERVAMVVVPLMTLGLTLALAARLTERLLDQEHAQFGLLIACLSVPLIYQMRPMRIDHHGWQVVCALAALIAFVAPRTRPDWRSGAIGGAMLGVLLNISLEGLPIAAALLALVALAGALQPTRGGEFAGAAGAAFVVAALLHLAMRGPGFLQPACDAMAPVWLAILATGAVAAGAAWLARRASLPVRLGVLAMGAVACIGILLLVDPRCAAGPFHNLDPLVRTLWYEKVAEGLPVWEQESAWAAMCIGLPLTALIGTVLHLRGTVGDDRARWLMMLGAQLASVLLAVQVSRASATACAFALPGGATVVLGLLRRARRVSRPLPRVAATAGALLVASPGLAALPLLIAANQRMVASARAHLAVLDRVSCNSIENVRALSILPPGLMLAPLDISPEIIAATRHRALASGHHRNAPAMRDVIVAFVGAPDVARDVLDRRRADYLVACPGFPELAIYRDAAPAGLWARLERGERFDWLQPVPIAGSPVLAWRVLRSDAPRR